MAARAPAATRADFADFYPLQTRWNDNDTYGHMNNVVHYALFDTAVNGWLIERGLLAPPSGSSWKPVAAISERWPSPTA